MIRRLALATSLAACLPAAAYAQDLTQEERAAGEKLYEDGTRLLAEKKYAEACPLLARAVEVVKRQGIGGLLALAECREGEGK
jgi:outer membrane protein assembly factor BamD (BamD/ComL family)